MSYATINDLQLRYRKLSHEEQDKALVLLDDASALIDSEFKNYGRKHTNTTLEYAAKKAVCCNIVRRVLASSSGADISNQSQTVGSFTESITYANPDGSLFLKNTDRKLLGLTKGKIQSVEVC